MPLLPRRLVLPCLIALLATLASAQVGRPTDHPVARELAARMELEQVSVQELAIPAAPGSAFSAALNLGGSQRVLELKPTSIRSADFVLLVQQADGSFLPEAAPQETTYVGGVAGIPGSRVAASLEDDGLHAMVRLGPQETVWVVEPLRRHDSLASRSAHVVYDGRHLAPTRAAGMCGLPPDDQAGWAVAETIPYHDIRECEIALDADFEFFQANGSSTVATYTAMAQVVWGMSFIWRWQVGVTFRISGAVIRTQEPDPYTSGNEVGLLNEVIVEWVTVQQFQINYDCMQLFTGKDMATSAPAPGGGGYIGFANIDSLCGPDACSWVQAYWTSNFLWRVILSSHEIGHIFNATHCDAQPDCGIMCGALVSCAQGQGPVFGAQSRQTIIAKKNSVSCLAPPSGVATVAVGQSFSVIYLWKLLWSWGFNNCGQLGLGPFGFGPFGYGRTLWPWWVYRPWCSPIYSIGYKHGLSMGNARQLYGWGGGGGGYYGGGAGGSFSSDAVSTPTLMPSIPDLAGVEAGPDFSFGWSKEGPVYGWGNNDHGQLGDGTKISRPEQEPVSGLTDVVAMSAGVSHVLALTADGRVWAWGDNEHGQLGNGGVTASLVPVPVFKDVMAVAAGDGHSLALGYDGTLHAWGRNDVGQLGLEHDTAVVLPTAVSAPQEFSQVDAGGLCSAALGWDGTVYTWGFNEFGQLGLGHHNNVSIPTMVPLADEIYDVACGPHHMLASTFESTVWAWGLNDEGQLGNGTTTNSATPVQVEGLHWSALGGGTTGYDGEEPWLAGNGMLAAGDETHVLFADARPDTTAFLIVGVADLDIPYVGGVLHASPDMVTALPTGAGLLDLTFPWPAGVEGSLLHYQLAVVDPDADFGYALSWGIRSEAPVR